MSLVLHHVRLFDPAWVRRAWRVIAPANIAAALAWYTDPAALSPVTWRLSFGPAPGLPAPPPAPADPAEQLPLIRTFWQGMEALRFRLAHGASLEVEPFICRPVWAPMPPETWRWRVLQRLLGALQPPFPGEWGLSPELAVKASSPDPERGPRTAWSLTRVEGAVRRWLSAWRQLTPVAHSLPALSEPLATPPASLTPASLSASRPAAA